MKFRGRLEGVEKKKEHIQKRQRGKGTSHLLQPNSHQKNLRGKVYYQPCNTMDLRKKRKNDSKAFGRGKREDRRLPLEKSCAGEEKRHTLSSNSPGETLKAV